MTYSWDFPYPAQRMPVMAKNVVASSQPLAAQAGLEMLRQGGNAVDAALAAAITLTVVEPNCCGIGSDAFAIVWDGRALHGLNGSGRSPGALPMERFECLAEMPRHGWDVVTVPGAVDAWAKLSERFGRVPFERLFEPAIHYGREGFPVSPMIARGWAQAETEFTEFPEFSDLFLPGGRAPRPGELFRAPEMAETLADIAETHGESFYRGALSRRIVEHARATGGAIAEDDLAEHTGEWVTPLSVEYDGVRLHEIPPNGQGLAALIALGILRRLDVAQYPVDSPDSVHLQVEAMKIAFAEVHRHVADPQAMEVAPEALLDEDFLAARAAGVRMDRAAFPESTILEGGGTVYLAAADESDMMVSFIQSNFMGFGSGIVVPGTGISMQNRGSGFSLEEGHPNRIAGGKRPYHTIIPGFVTRDGRPLMSFGVVGGHMQPQGHVQMILRIFTYGQNPQAASDAPRWLVANDFSLALEPGFTPKAREELERRGHTVAPEVTGRFFGGAQLILRLDDGYCAASDHRRDGQAVGF
jgi:gamma-glutamyltranspeptidase/glutathione hydrolase